MLSFEEMGKQGFLMGMYYCAKMLQETEMDKRVLKAIMDTAEKDLEDMAGMAFEDIAAQFGTAGGLDKGIDDIKETLRGFK